MLRGEGESDFSSGTEPSFGQELGFADAVKRSQTLCLESAMHSYAALQRNCNLSSKRNITLEDINYSRFFFPFLLEHICSLIQVTLQIGGGNEFYRLAF